MTPNIALPDLFLPLDSSEASLETLGGKALNLVKLVQGGFPVPKGFIIPTKVYWAYVAHNDLSKAIENALQAIDPSAPDDLAIASEEIQAQFSSGELPAGLTEVLEQAWRWLGSGPVAVRSSATAEDLPGLSFAGLQDTYLNILGAEALQQAVVKCWGSLWTARAIGYRQRNHISHQDLALAVVVQKMVASEVSGVLFTTNPVSGLRSETVIDATLGLGEALVSGQVEPDHYVVDTRKAVIRDKILGSKATIITPNPGGGVNTQQVDSSAEQALPDEVILELAKIGAEIELLLNSPQDIEWAWAGGELHILQSRPITSLFPLPAGMPIEPLKVCFSFAAVQGMLDPMTPLGRDAIAEIFASGARLFGMQVTRTSQTAIDVAGERLWVNITPVITNAIGRRILPVVFGMVEPSVRQAIENIWDDPRLQPGKAVFSHQGCLRIVRFLLPLVGNILLNLIAPRRRREYVIKHSEHVLGLMEARTESIQGDSWRNLDQRVDLLPDFALEQFPHTFLLFVSVVAAGMASWNALNMLAKRAEKETSGASPHMMHDLVLQVTRGMPNNPTTEMDLALWEMAKTIRRDPGSLDVFQNGTAAELATGYHAGALPPVTMQVVRKFLEQFGGRGLAEIDLGRTRWGDDPTYIFETLASYLEIDEESLAPDVVFARGADSAHVAIDQLTSAVRQTRCGWIKARLVRFFAGRARQLMGARESPKFFAVRMMWLVQRELLKSGSELTKTGDLDQPDDLFYLTLSELKSFAAREAVDWQALIVKRRTAYQREFARQQIPRLLLSDGRAYYEGVISETPVDDGLSGSPVSPGSVTGRVRVVLDPTQAGLQPGEILVCPGTDPSWTPLFLSAAGLVMEVGGMMTHGAVVAREYGLPAIVGVDRATTRLKTGQLIRIDGSSGGIAIIEEQ